MPFISSISSEAITSGPSSRTMRVDPDKVLALKAELQTIYNEVEDFVYAKGRAMSVKPLGADPVSLETASAFNENIDSGLDATLGYLRELKGVIDSLDQAAKTYNLVEDTHTKTFQRGVQ